MNAFKVIEYECGECETRYDDEEDAEACCREDEEEEEEEESEDEPLESK